MEQGQGENNPIESTETLQRRGLIASIVGLVAAGLFGRPDPARAADGDALILGKENRATQTTRVEVDLGRGTSPPAFMGCSEDRGGPSMGILGNADANVGRFFNNPPPDSNTANTTDAAGNMPLNFAAVAGEGQEIGVFGNAPDGVGIWGASMTNIGTWGLSVNGPGVLGTTMAQVYTEPPDPRKPITAYPAAGVFGVGGRQVGVWGTTFDSIAVWGQAAVGIGVAGQSDHIGGWFMIGNLPDDERRKLIASLEPAALHTTALGTNVSACFRAQQGIAVEAMALEPDGVALMTMGRVQSDMVGAGRIMRGADSAIIICQGVRETSHVQVTLTRDVGASSFWVEVMPGKGFMLHLDKRARQDGTFTYFVVEAMTHEH